MTIQNQERLLWTQVVVCALLAGFLSQVMSLPMTIVMALVVLGLVTVMWVWVREWTDSAIRGGKE